MPERRRLEAWLATPRGTLALLGGSLAFAALVAAATTTQRAFFEARVQEKYETVPADIDQLGRSLDTATPEQRAKVAVLEPQRLRQLYGGWMTGGEGWPASAPEVLVAGAPEAFLRFALQTLVAGSKEQQARAGRFLGRCRHVDARPLLELALRRAEARHEADVVERVRRELVDLGAPQPGVAHRKGGTE
jgi:hypothetical protein